MANPAPVQTYYVPFPEEDLFNETFETINAPNAFAPVNTLISIAIAADGTIVYYDHWEDGYDSDVNGSPQSTTEVWGDGDLTNGIAPGTGGTDILSAGDAIVLENEVPVPRGNDVLFDGRDRIQATFPIAVTRGAFPEVPGSLMAGAVEVLDTDSWGTEFVVPVGENTPNSSGTDPFQSSQVYVMAAEDNTQVFLNNVLQGTLNQGESIVIDDVNQGDEVTSSEPVQVDLVTGDINSTYELRWYSLVPREDWSNEYYSPVAEEEGATGLWFYNPNNSQITIAYEGVNGFSGSFTVAANSSEFIELDFNGDVNLPNDSGQDNIPGTTTNDYSGLRLSSTNGADFFALAQIDADGGGQIFDWGFPLVPGDKLTSQALIGWGYGNTNNDSGINSRSVVWVTATEDATVSVDFDGDGTVDDTFDVDELEALRLIDPNDQDMTGALVFATDSNGDTVDIAVAWGQDPSLSFGGDDNALDLGTTIPPLPSIDASKTAELLVDADNSGDITPGDTIRYSIRVVNVSPVADVPAGGFLVEDWLPNDTTYVLNSTNYDDGNSVTAIPDDGTTDFPLDEGGIASISILESGTAHTITFDAVIDEYVDLTTNNIINQAEVFEGANDPDPIELEVETPLTFNPAIEIEKTVALGHDNGGSFNSSVELVEGLPGTEVTYYFKITNTGDTNLDSIDIDDNNLGIGINDLTLLSGTPGDGLVPNEMAVYYYETTISGDLTNTATATGNPTFADGSDLDVNDNGQDDDNVTDNDTAEVDEVPPGSISGTVLEDTDGDGVGDTPLAGVTVELLDGNGDPIDSDPGTPGVQPTTTTTDANGDYSFNNLLPGDYQVEETNPVGFQDVSEADGEFDGGDDTDGGDNGIVNNIPVVLDPGENDEGNDFVDEEPGSISGTVLEDTDGDGVGDTPLAGVTVELLDGNGDPIDSDPGTPGVQPTTTTTDANGDYSFNNVSPGDYQVEETNPVGFQDVSEADGEFDGGDDTDGGDNGIVNNIPVVLDPGENDEGNDFVDEEPGSISGTVLEDTDGDGVGDTPLAGVTVELLDGNGDPIDSDPGTPVCAAHHDNN